MGNKDSSQFKHLKKEDIIKNQQENHICKIYMYIKNTLCGLSNGFFCKIPYPDKNHFIHALITTYRAINEKYINENKEIKLTLNNDKVEKTIKINKNRKIYISKEHDIVIIEIIPKKDNINYFLELDEKLLEENSVDLWNNSKIILICYGKENKMDKYEGIIKEIDGNYIYYISDIESGSGGCPILSLNSFKVFGVHLGRTKNKECKKGILLNVPLKEFMSGEKFFEFIE